MCPLPLIRSSGWVTTPPLEIGDWRDRAAGSTGSSVDPVFYQTVVPICEFAGGNLKEIRLFPVDLGFGRPMSQRGRPVLAAPDVAHEILTWLRDVSEPFGTEIEVVGTVGVVRAG